jgi:hypothetical protein
VTVPTDADLWLRGTETLLASWEEYARGATDPALQRFPGVATAVFRNGPERAVYNNVPQDHPGQSASSPQSWWSGPRATARPSAR